MNTNFGIYNYLSLINRRVAKAFRSTGRNPLPADFKITTEAIKERLYLNQMQSTISFPQFLFEDNKAIKKRFKASIRQLKQLQKMLTKESFAKTMSHGFLEKFSTYLKMRIFVTNSILKEFKRYFFNECDAYEEICAINDIFFELLDGTFEPDFDVRLYLDGLEQKYNIYYQERVSRLEEKVSEETKKKREKQDQLQKQAVDLSSKILKSEAKQIKTGLKTEKKQEKKKKSREVFSFKQAKDQKLSDKK